jgi:hypothetical protein
MQTFKFTVDTKPMAEEIKSVSRHVNGTTGAVVAMQTAVVIAEERAAEHVCNNVNKGFYSLIRSQISQKMAKLQSDVDSHLMQLVQQKNALLGIKHRMQKDYNMISKRYLKLFNGLNANLKQRVFELDKPTIDFAVKEVDKVSNRTKYLTGMVPVTQTESIASSQRIIASNIRLRGLNVINSMNSFLMDMNQQKKLTDKILINDSRYAQNATVYIPIVLTECNRGQSDPDFEISVSNVQLDNMSKSSIRNAAFEKLSEIEWSGSTAVDPEIKSEFSKLISDSSKSQRVNDMAMKLFQSANYQSIQM